MEWITPKFLAMELAVAIHVHQFHELVVLFVVPVLAQCAPEIPELGAVDVAVVVDVEHLEHPHQNLLHL